MDMITLAMAKGYTDKELGGEQAKSAILTLFRNATYVSSEMDAVIDNLEMLWFGGGDSTEIRFVAIVQGNRGTSEEGALTISSSQLYNALAVPLGVYLEKGKTYVASLGGLVPENAADCRYRMAVATYKASSPDLVFEVPAEGMTVYDNVQGPIVAPGWRAGDYQFTSTVDNEILFVNFKTENADNMTQTDYAELLQNFTVKVVG